MPSFDALYINGPFAFQPLEHFIETVAGWISIVEHCCTFHQSQSRAPLKSALGVGTNNFLQNQLIWINLLHAELKNPKDHFMKNFSTQSTVAGFHWRPILLEALERAFPPTELEARIGGKIQPVTSPLAKILVQQSCNNLSRWSKLRSLRLRIQPRMRMKWHCAESVVKNVSLSFVAAPKSFKFKDLYCIPISSWCIFCSRISKAKSSAPMEVQNGQGHRLTCYSRPDLFCWQEIFLRSHKWSSGDQALVTQELCCQVEGTTKAPNPAFSVFRNCRSFSSFPLGALCTNQTPNAAWYFIH